MTQCWCPRWPTLTGICTTAAERDNGWRFVDFLHVGTAVAYLAPDPLD